MLVSISFPQEENNKGMKQKNNNGPEIHFIASKISKEIQTYQEHKKAVV